MRGRNEVKKREGREIKEERAKLEKKAVLTRSSLGGLGEEKKTQT